MPKTTDVDPMVVRDLAREVLKRSPVDEGFCVYCMNRAGYGDPLVHRDGCPWDALRSALGVASPPPRGEGEG